MKRNLTSLVPAQIIENRILFIRGKKVMLDRDLAALYGVATRVLNQAVKRNKERFPEDFMFQLSRGEFENWKSQFVTSNSDKMGLRKRPLAFTEHGILMLSSVLHSAQAVQVNIQIMRVFVKLRQLLVSHKELAFKLKELDGKVDKHDQEIRTIFEVIKQLMTQPEPEPEKPKTPIGFHPHR